jgi:predicted phage gp36 major capsid-like protein
MAQIRLMGTLPAPEEARKNHKAAVARERAAEKIVANLKDALREANAALRKAAGERRTTEEDLDAIEGRRPG